LPWWWLDHGEDITSGLQREIKEEMQLKVDHIEWKCFDIVIGENLLNKYPAAYAIYKARLQSLDFTSSNECQEIQFYTPQEALKQKLFPIVKTFVKKLAT
jgi:ADP-ribose pyrophosphatase YjhB (NUDIX family)